jgi:hypothetical protein
MNYRYLQQCLASQKRCAKQKESDKKEKSVNTPVFKLDEILRRGIRLWEKNTELPGPGGD